MRIKYLRVPVRSIHNNEFVEQLSYLGCVVGELVEGQPKIGLSICSKKDMFRKKSGRELAMERFEGKKQPPKLRDSIRLQIQPQIDQFVGSLMRRNYGS